MYVYIYIYIRAISKTLGSRKGHPQIWEGVFAVAHMIYVHKERERERERKKKKEIPSKMQMFYIRKPHVLRISATTRTEQHPLLDASL